MNKILPFAAADAGLGEITNAMTGVFSDVKTAGITIVISAITLGTVFVGGAWLWGKTKQWLKKA